MKKTILTSLFFLFSLITFSQNCINVQWAYFDNPSGDNTNWKLYINWNANGTKNLKTVVKKGQTVILEECQQSSGSNTSGTLIYNFVSPNTTLGDLTATLHRFTGTCGNGTLCDSTLYLANNILPIKISSLHARNIKNTTEITFKIESIDDRKITFNFTLKNGQVKKYDVILPEYARDGETWVVTIDNINGTYKTKKL